MSQMNRRPAYRPAPQGRPAQGHYGQPGRPAQGGRPAQPGRPAPQRRDAPRQSAAPRGGGRGLRDVALLLVGGAVVAALALMLQGHWPNGFPLVKAAGANASANAVRTVSEIHSEGPLRVNEIMTSNRRTLSAGDGSSPDWVEVANVGNGAVDLRGWSLAKTDDGSSVFTFPDVELAPGECALVLCDSRLRAEAGEALHAPFRLSSAGDTLMLFNSAGTAVDTVNIPALSADSSYAREDVAQWTESGEPTPGLPNTAESFAALREPSGDSPVIVNEIVASNSTALADETGMYYDYIELCNRTGEAVDLTGWGLSDDANESRKWSFPQVSIAPGGYLVVFASGLDRTDDAEHLHTNFSLSSEGEQVALTDANGRMMDRVDFGLMKADEAWSLGADGSWGSAAPSPGSANP